MSLCFGCCFLLWIHVPRQFPIRESEKHDLSQQCSDKCAQRWCLGLWRLFCSHHSPPLTIPTAHQATLPVRQVRSARFCCRMAAGITPSPFLYESCLPPSLFQTGGFNQAPGFHINWRNTIKCAWHFFSTLLSLLCCLFIYKHVLFCKAYWRVKVSSDQSFSEFSLPAISLLPLPCKPFSSASFGRAPLVGWSGALEGGRMQQSCK